MIGKTISHYKIIEKLGEGGMGEVYLADDLKLERQVAIKFLPEHLTKDKENVERFEREAKAAAALNHPNIVTIYDVIEADDQICIVMEFVDGDSLRAKIDKGVSDLDDAIDITRQISEGLSEAHKADIVHRDIKPENILIGSRGCVKILDFGLAKLKGVSKLTKETSTLGTVHYMSPEQLQGKEVDHRTDIWSLGVVFYEMITGETPFKGEYESSVHFAILNEEPKPLADNISEALINVVYKCLGKNAEDRYQNIEGLLSDLQDFGDKSSIKDDDMKSPRKRLTYTMIGASILVLILLGYLLNPFTDSPQSEIDKTGWENSIAVLPFKDISPEKDQEWFCDGMTEQIISNLTRLPQLKVTGRQSVMKFKDSDKLISEIGKELDVAYVLESSIRKSESRIRVTAQLISTKDNFQVWSKDYDRDYRVEIFDLQDELSQSIATSLLTVISPKEKMDIKTKRPTNTAAYEYYLQGMQYYNTGLEPDLNKAIENFERVIYIDSTFASSYAGIALAYSVLGGYHILEPLLCWQRMQDATEKALIFDNELAEAHNTRALVNVFYEYDWQGAEKEFKRAIELNPNNSDIRGSYGHYLIAMSRFSEAIIQFEHGLKLDPFNMVILQDHAWSLHYSGQTDKAILLAENAIAQDSIQVNPLWYWVLAHLVSYQGKNERAIELTQIQMKHMGEDISDELAFLGDLYAQMGRKTEAQKVLEDLNELSDKGKFISPIARAHIYFSLGDIDKTMALFEEGYNIRDGWMPWLMAAPKYKLLRNDPRFIALAKKMGFK